MPWQFSDYLGFALRTGCGVVFLGYLLCVLPDFLPRSRRRAARGERRRS